MKRPHHPTGRRPWLPEGLEPRCLRTGGLAGGGADVLRELGAVSHAAAAAGVEATATIAPGGAVTFRFEAEAAGHYTLLVRYTGDGLDLVAKGPAGPTSIRPGPPGPFSVVPLTLDAATYEVTASARGGRPVFVDWELLLNTGVGQSAAAGASTTSTSASSFALPPGPTSAPATHADISASASASVSTVAAVAGPVGRPALVAPVAPVGPTTRHGSTALAYAGDGLPEGLAYAALPRADEAADALNLNPSLSPSPSPALLASAEGLADDEAALAGDSWLDRLATIAAPDRAIPASDAVALALARPAPVDSVGPMAEEEHHNSLAGIGPELIAGVAVAAAVARLRRGGTPIRRNFRGTQTTGLSWQGKSAAMFPGNWRR